MLHWCFWCCREALSALLPPVLQYLAGSLAQHYSRLDPAVAPVEALAQHFLDLMVLDAVLSKAGGGPAGAWSWGRTGG
jgi:hypothetical protein